jgi:hypothetical protein
MRYSVCFLLLSAAGAISACAGTYPEPAIVQSPGQWTLNAVYDQPQQITLKLTGEQEARRFWYIILTLTNESTAVDAPFYPLCQLMTDTFQIVTAKGARKEIFDHIKVKHQGSYPFLERLDYVDNKILQGADNAVDVVIIWPDFDPQAKEVTLFISGLSNETRAIKHPVTKDQNGRPETVLLRKTLALKYGIGGDPALRHAAGMRFLDQSWVMR